MAYYKIEQRGGDHDPRVIEADSAAAALRFAAKSVFTVSKPLKSADLVKAMKAGVEVETATDDEAATASE